MYKNYQNFRPLIFTGIHICMGSGQICSAPGEIGLSRQKKIKAVICLKISLLLSPCPLPSVPMTFSIPPPLSPPNCWYLAQPVQPAVVSNSCQWCNFFPEQRDLWFALPVISSLKPVSNVPLMLSLWCWGRDFWCFAVLTLVIQPHMLFEPSWMMNKVQIKVTSEKYFSLRYRGSLAWTRWGTKFNLGWTKTFLTMAGVNTAIFEH